ncbi:apolipoprotein D-like [Convolutriloba macropyga]|uniref:apolipoprotein D-like n=1 Tax=Convolutriloba macropyga TaxID=536237 RepID=UPI003F524270
MNTSTIIAFVSLLSVALSAPGLLSKWSYSDSPCPSFSAMANFSLDRFLGKWHEIQRYPNPMEVGCSCVVSDYQVTSQDQKGSYIKVNMTYIQSDEDKNSALNGLYLNGDNKAEFEFMPHFSTKPNVFFLDTDYETYALQYQCQLFFPYGQLEFAFILSRTETLPADLVTELKQKIADLGSDISKFEEPQHVGCPTPQ